MKCPTDLTKEEIVGRTDFDINPSDLAEKYINDDKKVMHTREQLLIEEIIYDKNRPKWFETIKTPVFNDKNEVIGTTGLAWDITDKRKIENALKESEKKYRTLTNQLPVGIYRTTADGKILFANPH